MLTGPSRSAACRRVLRRRDRRWRCGRIPRRRRSCVPHTAAGSASTPSATTPASARATAGRAKIRITSYIASNRARSFTAVVAASWDFAILEAKPFNFLVRASCSARSRLSIGRPARAGFPNGAHPHRAWVRWACPWPPSLTRTWKRPGELCLRLAWRLLLLGICFHCLSAGSNRQLGPRFWGSFVASE